MKATSTSTPMPSCGTVPRTAQGASTSRSLTIHARPLMRSTSPHPGIKNRRPICGFSNRFRMVSARRLPAISGSRRWRSSITCTKPGSPPRGDTSHRPVESELAARTKGEREMRSLQCESMEWISRARVSAPGSAITPRNSASERRTCPNTFGDLTGSFGLLVGIRDLVLIYTVLLFDIVCQYFTLDEGDFDEGSAMYRQGRTRGPGGGGC